jgi:hypothetical protein
MLPTATPMKMDAEVSIFLVVPPTLPDTRDRARTKTALEDPVRSEWVQYSIRALHSHQDV